MQRLSKGREVIAVCLVLLAIPLLELPTIRRPKTGELVPGLLGGCPTGTCPATPPTLITGVLGSCGDWPDCISGVQTGRLNRNGVAGTCASPKSCDIFNTTPGHEFDAYTIPNGTGGDACVTATLTVIDQADCNLQMNGYLNTFDPVNICEPQSDFLADAGFSSGTPPQDTSWCGTGAERRRPHHRRSHHYPWYRSRVQTTRSRCLASAFRSSCSSSTSTRSVLRIAPAAGFSRYLEGGPLGAC